VILAPTSSAHKTVAGCVAVCCSVLQCVAVCCSVSQCVAVCCSAMHCASTAVTFMDAASPQRIRPRGVEECSSFLRRVAVCCSVLQCVAVCFSVHQLRLLSWGYPLCEESDSLQKRAVKEPCKNRLFPTRPIQLEIFSKKALFQQGSFSKNDLTIRGTCLSFTTLHHLSSSLLEKNPIRTGLLPKRALFKQGSLPQIDLTM